MVVNKTFCCCWKNIQEKLLIILFFKVLLKNTLNTEIKNNLLPLCKVKYKQKTHFLNQSVTWYLHWKKFTNKKLVKAYQSILKRIRETHLNVITILYSLSKGSLKISSWNQCHKFLLDVTLVLVLFNFIKKIGHILSYITRSARPSFLWHHEETCVRVLHTIPSTNKQIQDQYLYLQILLQSYLLC